MLLLDRDGVLNPDTGYAHHPHQAVLLPGTAQAIAIAHRAGVPVAVVTNQSGLARGYFTLEQMNAFHTLLAQQVAQAGGCIAAFYHCPHLPELTGKCLCRKPGHLLVQRALALHGAVAAHSLLVGDSPRDCQAATAAGVPALWVGGQPNSPWPTLPSTAQLPQAVQAWLGRPAC